MEAQTTGPYKGSINKRRLALLITISILVFISVYFSQSSITLLRNTFNLLKVKNKIILQILPLN